MIDLLLPADGSPLRVGNTPLVQRTLALLTLVAVLYAIFARHWSDFVRYAPLCGLQAALAVYWAICARVRRGERPKYLWLATFGPIVLTLFVGTVYYSVFVAGKDIFLWLDPRLTSAVWRVVFVCVGVAVLGWFLFRIRMSMRFVYGAHEVGVGIFIAGYQAYRAVGNPSAWDSGVYLAIVTAGVYLVVRGLDNMHLGITKEPFDPFGRDMFGDYFDEKDDPEKVKISIYPSDLFFWVFPKFPPLEKPVKPPMPEA